MNGFYFLLIIIRCVMVMDYDEIKLLIFLLKFNKISFNYKRKSGWKSQFLGQGLHDFNFEHRLT